MTNIVMAMPYKAFVQKATEEGFRIFAIWDERVAQGIYHAHAEEYLRNMRQLAHGFQLTDFSDTETFRSVITKAVAEFDAEYVYHVGGEESMLATYRIAEDLGKAVNPSSSIELLNDKLAMRRLMREHGLSPVRFAEADHWSEVEALLDGFELPVVVKPTSLAGSRAVFLLRHRDQLTEWKDLLQSYDYDGPLLVEEYLRGPEFSVETLSDHGTHHVIGVTRKVLGPPPLFVEAGHVHPVREQERVQAMGELVVELLRLAGYQTGPAHTEIIWTGAGPRIVESQARLGGDQIPRLVELSTGVDMERGIFQALAGRLPPPRPREGVARISYFDLTPGMVTSVHGLDDVRALDFVDTLSFPFEVGDAVPETVDWRTRHGFVVVIGESEEQTLARVEEVRSLMHIDIDQHPLLQVGEA